MPLFTIESATPVLTHIQYNYRTADLYNMKRESQNANIFLE